MFWLPLTPNELTILGAIYAVQIENEDWGDEFALMEERWCSGFPYFRECLAKLLKLGYVRESVNRSGYPSSYLISAKACLEDGESNGYDKENPNDGIDFVFAVDGNPRWHTSGSWFPGEPETPQKRHGKGCGGTPFSMPFLLSH